MTVAVNAAAGTPSGQVSLSDGGSTLGTATLGSDATAAFHVVLATPGTHNLTVLYSGSYGFASSSSEVAMVDVIQVNFRTVSSVSWTAALAPGSFASAFGSDLSTMTLARLPPILTTLGGVTIIVIDAAGNRLPAPLAFVSPSQVNFLIPPQAAVGPAQLNLVNAIGTFQSSVVLAAEAPALFSADASGSGVAAAYLILGHADGTQDVISVFQGTDPGYKTVPLNLGSPSDIAELSLFGSGFDSGANVQVQIGATQLTPDYAGPQGQYPGLDQVNVKLPRSLSGSGIQQLSIVAGTASNSLAIEFQ
jgi:uncharacterized protein (TIGR03437 family)